MKDKQQGKVKTYRAIKSEIQAFKTAKNAKQYDEILEWAQLYDNCSISMKKVIVANMIDRVDVFRDYQLTIRLNITIEQFLISLENVA